MKRDTEIGVTDVENGRASEEWLGVVERKVVLDM